MGEDIEEGGNMAKAKEFSRTASVKVARTSRKMSKAGVGYTKTSINSIAEALPDSEIMIVAILAVTIFIRAEEAHLKSKFAFNFKFNLLFDNYLFYLFTLHSLAYLYFYLNGA